MLMSRTHIVLALVFLIGVFAAVAYGRTAVKGDATVTYQKTALPASSRLLDLKGCDTTRTVTVRSGQSLVLRNAGVTPITFTSDTAIAPAYRKSVWLPGAWIEFSYSGHVPKAQVGTIVAHRKCGTNAVTVTVPQN